MNQTMIAIIIFLVTYAFIITEKINRAIVAICGSIIMILLQLLDINSAFQKYVDWNTITLLIGMMILVGIINKTGVFQYLAVKTAKIFHGKPMPIFISLCWITAVTSAFLDNVTSVMLLVPVTFSITQILKINPIPFFIAEIVGSNIGGTATLIGDPPNIMIGSANKHLTFNMFLNHLAPVCIIILTIVCAMLTFIYRKQLKNTLENRSELASLNEKDYIQNRPLMLKSLTVLGLTILGFLFHSSIHVEPAIIAISGATLLLLISLRECKVMDIFYSIEWNTILFFIGLFILVGGLQEVGIVKQLALKVLALTRGDIPFSSALILWGSGFASATIDNVPFVATMIPLIKDIAKHLGLNLDSFQITVLWWSLALGSCLGGNGTIIGASANVVVAGLAAKKGKPFSYIEYLKVGLPVTFVSLFIAQLYLYFRYLY